MKKLLLSFLFFCQSLFLFAQDSVKTPSHFIEMGIAPISYVGDLNSSYDTYGSAVHIGFQFYRKKRFNSHFGILFGNVYASNPDYTFSENGNVYTPNQFANTSVFTINYDLQLNIIKRKYFRWYVGLGIGLIRFEPFDSEKNRLQNKLTTRASKETYGNLSAIFPLETGIGLYLPQGFGLGFQVALMNPTTDYLDNIGKWGSTIGDDQILAFRIQLHVPLFIPKLKNKNKTPLSTPVDSTSNTKQADSSSVNSLNTDSTFVQKSDSAIIIKTDTLSIISKDSTLQQIATDSTKTPSNISPINQNNQTPEPMPTENSTPNAPILNENKGTLKTTTEPEQ